MNPILSTSFFKLLLIIGVVSILSFLFSCKTVPKDQTMEQYENFLKPDADATEIFRVLYFLIDTKVRKQNFRISLQKLMIKKAIKIFGQT